MDFYTVFPVVTAAVAMIMDFRQAKVENAWVLFCMGTGLWGRLLLEGGGCISGWMAGTMLPMGLLGLLFLFRMLGAGDIKLFCALGGVMGPDIIWKCIGISFFTGAGISIAILISNGSFCQRFQYFFRFIKDVCSQKKIIPYSSMKPDAPENFHFTVPVFMSVLLYAGGVY